MQMFDQTFSRINELTLANVYVCMCVYTRKLRDNLSVQLNLNC